MTKKKIWILFIVLACIVLISAFVFKDHHFHLSKFRLRAVEDYIKSYGKWSIIAFLIIATIRPLAVFLPITLLTLIAGQLYGPVYGFILGMLSTIISSNVAFFISRYFGKSFVEKLLRKRTEKLQLRFKESGFKYILILRISGIFPLDIVSYTAGLTKIKYEDFMLATLIGTMPETFSVAYMGHHIKNPLSPGFILSVILVIITIGVPVIYNKIKSKKEEKNLSKEKNKKIV